MVSSLWVPIFSVINDLKSFLQSHFKLKNLGHLRYFLGLDIAQSAKRIFFSQRHYTFQLLEDSSLLANKPPSVLMIPHLKLSANEGDLVEDASSIVGLLVAYYILPSLGQISFMRLTNSANLFLILENPTWMLFITYCSI